MARGRDYTPNEYREQGSRMPALEHAPDLEIAERGTRGGGQVGGAAHSSIPEIRSSEAERTHSARQPYREIGRDRALMRRDSEIRTLAEIGTFRTLALDDLAKFRYAGDRNQAASDIRSLTRQGLVRVQTAHTSRAVYLALTRKGLTLLKRHRPQDINPNQVFYARFVKPREVKHDANLYQLYQEAAARIVRDGGRIQRVVLDFELKKSVYRQLAKLRELPESDPALREQRRQQVAQEHGLTVVNGKIPLPDLRIEYETAERDQTKVDLELATSDYHRDSLAEKARAGFAIFAMREDAAPLRRAIADPELTRDIFSI
jgi:hypothetical protein